MVQSAGVRRSICSNSWHLLWCSKRCFKPEQEKLMADVQVSLADIGGKLVCKKKAQQLTQPVPSSRGRSSSSPLVLVTDWREAKPCLQSLMFEASANEWPILMIVACDDAVSKTRALSWQQALGDIGIEVVVCLLDDLQAMLGPGGLVSRRVQGEPEERGFDPFSKDQQILEGADAATCLGTTTSGESSPRSIEEHKTTKHETVFADDFHWEASIVTRDRVGAVPRGFRVERIISADAGVSVAAQPGRLITDAAAGCENSMCKTPPGRFITAGGNDENSIYELPPGRFITDASGNDKNSIDEAPQGCYITDAGGNDKNSIDETPPGRFITDASPNEKNPIYEVQSLLYVALGPLNVLDRGASRPDNDTDNGGEAPSATAWAERVERLLREHLPDHYED